MARYSTDSVVRERAASRRHFQTSTNRLCTADWLAGDTTASLRVRPRGKAFSRLVFIRINSAIRYRCAVLAAAVLSLVNLIYPRVSRFPHLEEPTFRVFFVDSDPLV